MRNIRLDIEYDGRCFAGFQRQPKQSVRTVQGELEAVLSRVLSDTIKVVCAGRTDAGVHAVGQVVSFRTGSDLPVTVVQRAVNGLFHGDLAVLRAVEVDPRFHARHSAVSRQYEYLIYRAPWPPSIMAGHVWHVHRPLDLDRMRDVCRLLLGPHDFRSFSSQGSHLEKTRRTVLRLDVGPLPAAAGLPAVAWRLQGDHTLRVAVEADGFLPHMVRMMVGTMVRVGTGEWPLTQVQALLEHPRNGAAGPPAPPQGLCFVGVTYPDVHNPFTN